ncbi:helix-turn-helix domain-containing protein [Trichococcus flocculiformis]|uniref:helix-turn-helix domain-containing protein n=1 Tax=Trichococcus flocculiformis TaxID=82803 RepID=UPI002AAB29C4|nr:helix-turn-helix transcriptional regulator [Trichococcus flocculiformis]
MTISYDSLWKKLIDKKMTRTQLRDMADISNSTLARLSKNQNVTVDVIDRICTVLDCDVSDVMSSIREKVVVESGK